MHKSNTNKWMAIIKKNQKSYIDVENSHCWNPTHDLLVTCPDRLGMSAILQFLISLFLRWYNSNVFVWTKSNENERRTWTRRSKKGLFLWIRARNNDSQTGCLQVSLPSMKLLIKFKGKFLQYFCPTRRSRVNVDCPIDKQACYRWWIWIIVMHNLCGETIMS